MPLGAQLVLMLLFGVAGVHHARHLEKKYGASAWGLPSWVWGLITAFSLLLGAILLYCAERPLKRLAALPVVPAQPASYPSGMGYGATVSAMEAATPAPAMVAATPAPVAAASVAAGWHPDPSGRHQLRWWDGERWTSSVHDNGVTSTDA